MSQEAKTKNPELVSRREFLGNAAATAIGGIAISPLIPGCQVAGVDSQSVSAAQSEAMDEALKMLRGLAPNGNHGPMAAEALISLERAESVGPWVADYKRRFTGTPPPRKAAISPENWREALGDRNRNSDWVDFFERELKENPWQDVLRKWSVNLAPGLAAAALHGVIRTGHAARSLAQKDNSLRRAELAEGLGYWASWYQELPGRSETAAKQFAISDALKLVPHLPPEKRRSGSVTNALSSLEDLPEFAVTAGLLEISGDSATFISGLTAAFAKTYLLNISSNNAIGLVHAVTGATALRSLMPYVDAAAHQNLLRYAWQAGAAVYSVYGIETPNAHTERPLPDKEALIGRAVKNGDEHAIKFTESCLGEFAINRDPVYLFAADDAISRF